MRKENQQDATIQMVYCQLWMLIIDSVSTCFGHLYAHLQEQRPRVTAYEVYLLVMLDVAGCGAVVLHSDHTLSVAPQHRNLPHPTLPANNSICNNTWSFSPDDGHKDARNMLRQCQ